MTVSSTAQRAGGDYAVRLFEPRDRAGFLSLYDRVFGGRSDGWFDWKYAGNPYTDHVSIVLALDGETVVGAKAGMGFELARAGRRLPALQPADTMVHPDHRRRGLYSRMTEYMKDHYADRERALFFNYPNEATLAGSLKHGWERVGTVTTRYRVHDPAAVAGLDAGPLGAGPLDGVVDAVGRGLASGLLGARRLVAGGGERRSPTGDTTPFRVRRHETVPVETLAGLYRRHVPDRFHVVRDERYLRWRYGNPDWAYTAYTVERDGEAVCGAVVGRGHVNAVEEASLVDVLPLGGPARAAPTSRTPSPAATALLGRVLEDYRDVDVVTASDDAFPAATLSAYGFLPDTGPPLSWVSSPSILVAYPLSSALDRRTLGDRDAWHLGLGDRDTR